MRSRDIYQRYWKVPMRLSRLWDTIDLAPSAALREHLTIVAGIAGVIGLCWWALTVGTRIHELSHLQEVADTGLETELVCASLSMPAGSDRFPDCAAALDRVRRSHEDRVRARDVEVI